MRRRWSAGRSGGLARRHHERELQVTAGSYLQRFGYLTEAEGDQPGSIAALRRDVVAMGFEPLVYGNVKGFLNHTPTRPEMEKWAALQGISVEQVTSFTDGTKVHIEQVVVANGLGADLAPGGMVGGDTVHDGFKEGAYALAEIAERAGIVMSDFLMASNTPSPGRDRPTPGVFIVATMPDARQRPSLKYYKLGEGPYYFFERPFHLCHFELPKTIRAVVDGDAPLLEQRREPALRGRRRRQARPRRRRDDRARRRRVRRPRRGRGDRRRAGPRADRAALRGAAPARRPRRRRRCASATSSFPRARRSRPGSAPSSPGGRARAPATVARTSIARGRLSPRPPVSTRRGRRGRGARGARSPRRNSPSGTRRRAPTRAPARPRPPCERFSWPRTAPGIPSSRHRAPKSAARVSNLSSVPTMSAPVSSERKRDWWMKPGS